MGTGKYIPHLMIAALSCILCSCDADAPTPPPVPLPDGYHQPTAPDSVVANLLLAHKNRDRTEYGSLLAPEFKFFFIATDVLDFGTPSWDKTQDSTGTAAMFQGATKIDITATSSTPSDADPNFYPPGTQIVHLHSVEMTVLEPPRTTWVVSTDQDLYLRPGDAAAGEDPTHWFLSEWRELEPLNAPGIDEPTPVRGATWGEMKHQYLALGTPAARP